MQLRLLVEQRLEHRQALLPERAVGVEAGLLRQVADLNAVGAVDQAGSGFFFTDQNAQQGGFTHPVGAHQADAAFMRNRKRDVAENIQGTV